MPTTATTDTASELAGQPFGQVWDESQMCPGALRIIDEGKRLVTEEKAEAKRLARNAKAREARAAKQAAYLAAVVTVVEPVVEPVVEAAPPAAPEPALPPVLVHGNYKLHTPTGRLKYGNVEITADLNAASLHVTPTNLRRLPASPNVVRRDGKLHLTDKSMREFMRVLS